MKSCYNNQKEKRELKHELKAQKEVIKKQLKYIKKVEELDAKKVKTYKKYSSKDGVLLNSDINALLQKHAKFRINSAENPEIPSN